MRLEEEEEEEGAGGSNSSQEKRSAEREAERPLPPSTRTGTLAEVSDLESVG